MIGTTGTSFPVVEARHDVPGCRSARRAPRAPLPPVALDDRHQLPAVDRHGRHDSAPRARRRPLRAPAPASRRRSSATGPRPLPPVALDDRHQLPGCRGAATGQDRGKVDDRHGRHGHRAARSMIGTTFPASIIGNRAGPRGKVDDRQQLPAVDRHGRHDRHHGHQLPGCRGRRHDVPGCRSARRAPRAPLPPVALDDRHQLPAVDRHGRHDSAPRARRRPLRAPAPASRRRSSATGPRPLPPVALDDRHQLPGCRGAATGQDRGKVDDRHGRHGHRAARSMIGTTFPASIIGNRAGPRGKVDDRQQLPAVDRHGRHDSAPRAPASRLSSAARRSRLSIGTTGTTGTVATRGPG